MSSRNQSVTPESLDKRDLLKILTAFRRGDFSARITTDAVGIDGKIAEAINDVIELNEKMTREFARSLEGAAK